MNSDTTDRLLNYVFEHAVRNEPGSVIDAIDAYNRDRGGMIHLGHEKGELFDRIVRRSGPSRVLELGTNYGYSALRMARLLDVSATIQTVEVDSDLAATARALFAYSGLDTMIEVICGEASQVIGRFSKPFDFVFVDHFPENYLADLRLIEHSGLLREGAIVVSDNVVMFERQLTPYLDHLRNGGGYDSTLHQPSPTSDGIEASVKLGVNEILADPIHLKSNHLRRTTGGRHGDAHNK